MNGYVFDSVVFTKYYNELDTKRNGRFLIELSRAVVDGEFIEV